MTSNLKESTLRTWVDESFIDQRFKQKSNLHMEEVCQKIITNFDFTQKHAQDTETSVSDKKRRGKRWSTERWLEEIIEKFDVQFKDFISISFHKPNKDIINQYLDAGHIKNVILDFFYKRNRPVNKIKIWIIVEREGMFFRQGKNLELDHSIFSIHFYLVDNSSIIFDSCTSVLSLDVLRQVFVIYRCMPFHKYSRKYLCFLRP